MSDVHQREKPLSYDERICRFEFRPHLGNGEEIIKFMADAGIEVLVASAMHQNGEAAYPSKIAPAHPEMDPAYVGALLSAARNKDIMVLSWFNMNHNHNEVFARLHPEWRLLAREAGKSHVQMAEDRDWKLEAGADCPDEIVPERNGLFCLFSSPYREYVKAYAAEILQIGFDGLWFDASWPGSYGALTCYCNFCQKAFREETGASIPEKVEWESPTFQKWVRWRYRRFDEFVTGLYHHLQEVKPGAVVMMNHYNRPRLNSKNPAEGISWRNGVSMDVMQFPGGGGNENTSVMNRTHTTGFNARIVKAQCPWRFDVWEPGGTLWRSSSYSFLENDRTHSLLHGVWTLALGGVPWTACINTIARNGVPDPSLMNELKKRRPYIGGTPMTYCGIHYSQSSRDFWGKDAPGAYFAEVYGFYDIAVEGQYLTDLVLDGHLEDLDYVRRYRVIILPNSSCLSQKQVEVLRTFVSEGGVLIGSFETGLYDRNGVRKEDFQLQDVFGVNHLETVSLTPREWGETIYDRDNIPVEIPALRINDPRFREEQARYAFVGANYTKVKIRDGASSYADTFLVSEFAFHHGELEEPRGETDSPAIIVNRFGKGHGVYFAPEYGRGFLQWPHPENRRLVQEMIDLGSPEIEVTAPKVIEMTAFRHGSEAMAVHLVNLPFCSNRTALSSCGIPVLDEVVPVHGIEVRIHGAAHARNVSIPIAGSVPEVARDGNDLVVTVPCVELHEVIWIEF